MAIWLQLWSFYSILKWFTMSTQFDAGSPLDGPEWISQAEAARIRGVSRQAIARLVKRGKFKVLSIGGRKLLDLGEVRSFAPQAPGRRKSNQPS